MNKIDPYNMPNGSSLPKTDPDDYLVRVGDLKEIISIVAKGIAECPDRAWGFKRGEILSKLEEILHETKKISFKKDSL